MLIFHTLIFYPFPPLFCGDFIFLKKVGKFSHFQTIFPTYTQRPLALRSLQGLSPTGDKAQPSHLHQANLKEICLFDTLYPFKFFITFYNFFSQHQPVRRALSASAAAVVIIQLHHVDVSC